MYCKIVDTDSELFWGTEKWILTHECGHIEKRMKKSRGSRVVKDAPVRVKCNRREDTFMACPHQEVETEQLELF